MNNICVRLIYTARDLWQLLLSCRHTKWANIRPIRTTRSCLLTKTELHKFHFTKGVLVLAQGMLQSSSSADILSALPRTGLIQVPTLTNAYFILPLYGYVYQPKSKRFNYSHNKILVNELVSALMPFFSVSIRNHEAEPYLYVTSLSILYLKDDAPLGVLIYTCGIF